MRDEFDDEDENDHDNLAVHCADDFLLLLQFNLMFCYS